IRSLLSTASPPFGDPAASAGRIRCREAPERRLVAAVAQPSAEILHAEPGIKAARRVPVEHVEVNAAPAALDRDRGEPGHQPPAAVANRTVIAGVTARATRGGRCRAGRNRAAPAPSETR